MLYWLIVFFGALVGFALGLTGGGGSLLAVPLLVYGLAIAPRDAFGISLAVVGATALVGMLPRLGRGQVEIGTGVLFAAAGMVGAPIGTWLAGMIPETILLVLFSLLILTVAWRMTRQPATESAAVCDDPSGGPTCRRTPEGKLRLTSGCAMLLVMVGLTTGVLSGMFGVGGGFVIVPALVLFSGMAIHRAIATSLLVIVLVSISGVASHFVAGRGVPLELTGLFIVGGVIGMFLGGRVASRLSTRVLQRVFASGLLAVAVFIVGKTLV